MIRILYRHTSGALVHDLPVDQLASATRDANAVVWVDMEDPSPNEQHQILEEIFNFHPLAVEDATNSVLLPKINDYRRYLYIVIHSIYPGDELVHMISSELDIFLGPNFLITIHDREMSSINSLLAEREYHNSEGISRGPALLLYEILESQVDRITRLLDNFEAELERLGDIIFQKGDISRESLLDDLLTAQSSALRLNRVLQPQRDLMNRLAQTDYGVIPATARPYFADIYDHLVRMVGLVDSMRELARSTIEIYMALSNNRMNEIIKVLTIISTIFLPLSFLAGVYGMNFHFMPELGWPWSYPVVWVAFLSVAGTMLLFFRRRGWL
ncbi:MAG: magnesium/cobalt transporter CorA [Caldilineaceae bacterium]|nr:magnesium/cobalt transporter CorA [Caldilineaceae bacterium]